MKTDQDDKILIIGTTNRPEELDEAARRRFTKKIYVPLPNNEARLQLISSYIISENKIGNKIDLDRNDLNLIASKTKGYSCADIHVLFKEVS